MTVKKRSAHNTLPPMPLSELPMMRALLAISPARGKATRKHAIKSDPKQQLAILTPTIVDKIQVLALRCPRALIVVAQVLLKALDQQLELLPDTRLVDRASRKVS